jgi:hypothetical protein
MTALIFCISLSIFSHRGFGPHIQKGVIDDKEVARRVFEKLGWFLIAWYSLNQFLPNLVYQFMISFFTIAVLHCITYTWKYFKGFEF